LRHECQRSGCALIENRWETLNVGNIAIQSKVVTNRAAHVERWATFHYFARRVLEQARNVLE
jgi:hypothetical protein